MDCRLSHRFAAIGRRDSRNGGSVDCRHLFLALFGALGHVDDDRLVFGEQRLELKNACAQTLVLFNQMPIFFDLKHLKQAEVKQEAN